MVVAHIRRGVALEDHRRRRLRPAIRRHFADLVQVLLAPLVRQPYDLEGVVALDEAVGVVVDRFAGPRQQPGRGVVGAEDQLGVGLAALQRDADRHLIDGAAGQAVGAAQRLRAEKDVQAECTALPHQPVQQLGRVLRDAVVFREKLLKFIHNQQNARRPRRWRRLTVGVEVLRPVARKRSPRTFISASSRCSTLRPNSRSLSTAMTRACGRPWAA